MIRAGVLGATGYTGFETIKILARHPAIELAFATARSDAGKHLGDLFATPLDLLLRPVEEVDLGAADLLFLCLPHGAAQEYAAAGLEAGCRVVDLSADFRLHDPADFQRWYKEEHRRPALLAEAVYGLTEWRRAEVRRARLVANPGCYPTSILLALAPLLQAGLLGDGPIIADSKSGVSGAGRAAKVGSLFAEVSENFKPYNIGHGHRHIAEIEQEMSRLSRGATRRLIFSPHLLPVIRGILSTVYVPLPDGWNEAQLWALYAEAYADEPFIWLLPAGQTASLAHTVNTNRCAISLHPVPELNQLIIVSSLDNLVKGAAGQAVQNCNVMFGLEETLGL
ncbi:MAG: N-acetyl-gamma-glutamyl-phosphate reductase [Ardenticatenaceae bacterium]|nr:N-acetyl-gamma-glutamyl-phosphate reductase [Ardenticatenaceae bacterium]HBY96338.1 N-acetyl-gamma-glutamyl-phosphate reductase [Chloroflexota bacterium]